MDETRDRRGDLVAVTLGPSGSWFVQAENKCKCKLPRRLLESLSSNGDLKTITCIALGYNSSYVAVWQSGLITWDLNSQYAGLESSLESVASGIKVRTSRLVSSNPQHSANICPQAIALDVEGGVNWAYVTNSGVVTYSISYSFMLSALKRWADQHDFN